MDDKLEFTFDRISNMELETEDIEKIMACPYFDREIFYELTGVKI